MYIVQNPIAQNFEKVLTRHTILAAKLCQIEEQLAKLGPAVTAFRSVVAKVPHRGESVTDNLFLHAVQYS